MRQEIKPLKKRFYDYETKYTEGYANHIMPAKVLPNIYQKAMEMSEKACKLVHASKGICRAEFLYEESTREIYILEVNTHPGMASLSVCPEIAAHTGMSYNKLVQEVLNGASYEK